MGKVSRFGTRFDERIAAAKAAEDAERARIAAMTPHELAAERVTEAAKDWEMTQRLGETIANGIKVGLKEVARKKRVVSQSAGGWFEAISPSVSGWTATVDIKTKFELDRWGYAILVQAGMCSGLKRYFLPEEVLVKNSESTKDYEKWMLGVCDAMFVLIGDPWFARVEAERNNPGNFKPEVRPGEVNVAITQVQALGVMIDDLDEVREDAEAEAIASIMRTAESAE